MRIVDYIETNRDGLAKIKKTSVLVGDVLIMIFFYKWSADELISCFPCLTPQMINAALKYATMNPDTLEGQFYYSIDPCPLMRNLGLI